MSTASVNGIELYYEVFGSGPPLTLIMGLGCSARQWQWMAPYLAETFQVIIFDNRGSGRSGKPDSDYTTELFADDMRGLLDALYVEKTHVFGVSVGGMIAQRFALQYPERTDRLVLGCTMPDFRSFPPASEDIAIMAESQSLAIEDGVEQMLALFLSPQFRAACPGEAARLRDVMRLESQERGMEAFLHQLAAAMSHDTRVDFANINAQTLVICGDNDRVAPVENSRFLAAQIPSGTLVELPGAYHAFWVENAVQSCRTIRDFLLP